MGKKAGKLTPEELAIQTKRDIEALMQGIEEVRQADISNGPYDTPVRTLISNQKYGAKEIWTNRDNPMGEQIALEFRRRANLNNVNPPDRPAPIPEKFGKDVPVYIFHISDSCKTEVGASYNAKAIEEIFGKVAKFENKRETQAAYTTTGYDYSARARFFDMSWEGGYVPSETEISASWVVKVVAFIPEEAVLRVLRLGKYNTDPNVESAQMVQNKKPEGKAAREKIQGVIAKQKE